jgi:hypothetical protein
MERKRQFLKEKTSKEWKGRRGDYEEEAKECNK